MMIILPRKLRLRSDLTVKQLTARFDRKIIPFKARGSVIGVSSFIKKYRTSEVFYGSRNGGKIRVSHHAPKKTDGSSTTFYGSIMPDGEGSVITGRLMKPLSTCIFGGTCIVVSLFLALVCLAIKLYAGAAAFAAAGVLTLLLLFRDSGKSEKLRAFLEKLTDNNTKGD